MNTEEGGGGGGAFSLLGSITGRGEGCLGLLREREHCSAGLFLTSLCHFYGLWCQSV